MSEDREDDAKETGARIGDLPASDSELSSEESGSGASGGGQPTPEAWIPLPNAGQPSPGGSDAQRSSPPPPDPGNVRGTHPGEPYDPQ